jgi:hypothetical protein
MSLSSPYIDALLARAGRFRHRRLRRQPRMTPMRFHGAIAATPLSVTPALPPVAAHAACKARKAESDVIGIRIADADSVRRVIGSAMKNEMPAEEKDKDAAGADASFPFVRLANRDGREELKLFTHYGDEVGSYNEIEVAPAKDSHARRLPVDAFATERGVKLGMREAALTALLGSCFTRERAKDGAVVIAYAIDDMNHPLLKRTNMPGYYARYVFRGGQLARFEFGFEYP